MLGYLPLLGYAARGIGRQGLRLNPWQPSFLIITLNKFSYQKRLEDIKGVQRDSEFSPLNPSTGGDRSNEGLGEFVRS